MEEALNTKCNEDVVCEVAAVEAVCEEILAEAEEEYNTIDFFRRKRSIDGVPLVPSWPGSSTEGPLEAGWMYWFRGTNTRVERVRRETVNFSSLEDMGDLARHKRQFGFSLDHLILGEGRAAATTAATPETQNTDSNKIGALIDLISRSMASDVGAGHFTTFLSNLQPQDGDYSSEDFMTAFSKEFGEDKVTALRELAREKLGLTGFSANHTFSNSSSFSSSSISSSFSSSSSSVSNGHSVESEQQPSITKKTFKVQFKVEG